MDLQQNNAPAPRTRETSPASHHSAAGVASSAGSVLNKILVVLLIVAVLLGIGTLVSRFIGGTQTASAVKGKQYQALFLTNGQVYFGHLAQVESGYVKLNDIYYLQVQQQVQPDANKNSNQQPQISLAKLGGELHGPEDVMYVNRDQVLFWENLKNDGKVVKAIQDFQASNKK
ncbi:MAG TPA: hypothetical protein VLF41_02420 [Candidatus Nanoarchaeia archaeon]|nr:hypothetical protein [Candidatus Nanoarchaeia archaeon]